MPHSVKLQEEHGEDLAVLFVEVQGTPKAKAEAFALEHEWLGGRAIWTTERPFNLDIRGIPQFALLSPDGEIVLSGHNSSLQGQMEDMIEDMIKSLRKGPDGLPRSVARAWADMSKGDYADSLEEAEEIVADADSDEEVEAAKELIETLKQRVDARVARVEWMLENGYPLDAEEQLEELEDSTEEAFGVAEKLAELRATLESDEFEPEIDAAEDLARIEKKLFEDPDDKYLKKLDKFLEEHAGTKVAKRAEKLREMTAMATS